MKKIHYFSVLVFLLIFNLACTKEEPIVEIPPGEIEFKDQNIDASIMSQNVGETYPLKIFIPKSYRNGEKKDLPVVYLLDGLTVFEGLTFYQELLNSMAAVNLDAILVAVGDKTGLDRARDFLAEDCLGGKEADFNNFYKFMTEEVVPYIDRRYETDVAAKTLIGHSHAGSFTNNAFLKENPDDIIFHHFISVDPSDCEVARFEEQIDKLSFRADADLKIHLSKVDNQVEKLNDLLVAKNFPFLEIEFKTYPDETHASVTVPAIQDGLKFIYGL